MLPTDKLIRDALGGYKCFCDSHVKNEEKSDGIGQKAGRNRHHKKRCDAARTCMRQLPPFCARTKSGLAKIALSGRPFPSALVSGKDIGRGAVDGSRNLEAIWHERRGRLCNQIRWLGPVKRSNPKVKEYIYRWIYALSEHLLPHRTCLRRVSGIKDADRIIISYHEAVSEPKA
jgi:hypothetical protein